jgi:hypothetical protein
MRRLLTALVVGASLTVLGAGTALAEAPLFQFLPGAACNQGTTQARVISGNPIVPMFMVSQPSGCMTMPALHP